MIVEEFLYAPGTLLPGRGVGVAANECDPAAAVAVQMLSGRVPAIAVLRAHVIDIHSLEASGQ